VTEQEKRASMNAYGDHGPISSYEYDHLVPLELGGATNDPRNLWPEPGATPNPKDNVEGELNREVCEGSMTLVAAQNAIAANWVRLARAPTSPPSHRQPTRKPTAPAAPSAWCSASAQYNSNYNDYDVYVHSNQPDETVTVTAAGTTASWYTDHSGYADVYFHAGRSAAGDRVAVDAGRATCSAAL
jgi:hypothetical protein